MKVNNIQKRYIALEILIHTKLRKTPVYDVYWKFAYERQNVFFNRLLGEHNPWTSDPVIEKYKFTNTYRVLDRVSQFLMSNIISQDEKNNLSDEDRLFRILIFKIFNKIETWQLLERYFGCISWSHYSFKKYDKVLNDAFNNRTTIYSAAYIMASGRNSFGCIRKHQNHLKLIELMMENNLTKQISSAGSMAELYHILLSYPLIGQFLAYQYATDINYSPLTNFSEEEFVMAGPGAHDGILKCFSDRGSYSDEDIIRYMMDRQEHEFGRLSLDFKNLFGRPLQLIDCQNLFCEVGKYARVSHPQIRDKSGRTRIKQVYKTKGALPAPCFPQKWGLSNAVHNFYSYHSLVKKIPQETQ